MEPNPNSNVTQRQRSKAKMPVAGGEAQATVSPQPSVPTPDEIRQLAFEKWEAAGKPPGDGSDFWLQAEKELLDRNVVGGSPVRTRRRHTVAPSGSRIPPDAVQHREPRWP